MSDQQLVHATAVAIDGRAILLRGSPGAGKSDLALRLIDGGARLVADDQCALRRVGAEIRVTAPPAIAGLVEVRGLGILRVEAVAGAVLALIADLVDPEHVERLPPFRTADVLGMAVPLIAIAPFQASAAIKLQIALRVLAGGL